MFVVKNVFSGKDAAADKTKDYARARLLSFRGHFSEAAGVFQQLAAQFPKYGYFFDYQSGMCYFYMAASGETTDRAMAMFKKCGDNANAPAYIRSHSIEMSGDIQRRRGLDAEAVDLYRRALVSDPQYSRQKELRMKLAELKKR